MNEFERVAEDHFRPCRTARSGTMRIGNRGRAGSVILNQSFSSDKTKALLSPYVP